MFEKKYKYREVAAALTLMKVLSEPVIDGRKNVDEASTPSAVSSAEAQMIRRGYSADEIVHAMELISRVALEDMKNVRAKRCDLG